MAVLTLRRRWPWPSRSGGRRPAGLGPGRRPGGRAAAMLVAGSILRTSSGQQAQFLAGSAGCRGADQSDRKAGTAQGTTVNPALAIGCPGRPGVTECWLPEGPIVLARCRTGSSALAAATPFAVRRATDRPQAEDPLGDLVRLPGPSITSDRILAASTGLGSLVGRVVGA
jgi:hypothetical protein